MTSLKKIIKTIWLWLLRHKMPQIRFNLMVQAYVRKHRVHPSYHTLTLFRKVCGIKQPRLT
jgi:hypothetical protein